MSNGPFSFSKRDKKKYPLDGITDKNLEILGSGKAILGEYGWIFLINDTNDFFEYQFGNKKWNSSEIAKSEEIILDRISSISSRGVPYIKFIVPEKSVVYREYLPSFLQNKSDESARPAKILSKLFKNNVYYMDTFLNDAKSYGFVYFRGDSHTSWIGSFFVYRYISELLFSRNLISVPPLDLKNLEPSLAGYDGDLYSQLGKAQSDALKDNWEFLLPENTFEITVSYKLLKSRITATIVENSYKNWFPSIDRDIIVYENTDSSLPRAVVFRDSTVDLCHELIAQHFSRCVFVWHNGAVIGNILEMENPDVVIHVMAERFVSAYPKFEPISYID